MIIGILKIIEMNDMRFLQFNGYFFDLSEVIMISENS